MMFRQSAVIFNTHRVHYDRDYATKVEGHPGLVVPVTLVSALILELCRANTPDRRIISFAYRSLKRVFDLGPFTVLGALDGGKLCSGRWITRVIWRWWPMWGSAISPIKPHYRSCPESLFHRQKVLGRWPSPAFG